MPMRQNEAPLSTAGNTEVERRNLAGTTRSEDTSSPEESGGEPSTTPDKGVTRSQKPAAISGEEGKDAGDKSRTTIGSYDATPETKPETKPANHRRRRCVAGDKNRSGKLSYLYSL
ncbi:hypothetical protein YC2023_058811 [Brassica napus]